jgi:hypothetical protein
MLAFLYPFNVELSMTQKFSPKLFGSNILDTKITKNGKSEEQAVCMTFMLASKNALQHKKGQCNTWPFSDTRLKYERVTFCNLLPYISIDLFSFVYVANSYVGVLISP